jgi:hypothetical protein
MQLKFSKNQIVFIVLIFLSIVLWAYFLNSSNLTLERFFEINSFKSVLKEFFSTNFIAFLLTFPLTYAFIVNACNSLEKKEALITVLLGVLLGLLFSLAVFQNLLFYWIAGIFYFASFLLIIEIYFIRKTELKKFKQLRLLNETTQKSVVITALGVFVLIALTVLSQQEVFINKFENQLVSIALPSILQQQENSKLLETSADLIIETQKSMLEQIINSPAFLELKSVENPKVLAFVLGIEQLENELNSPEYRQKVLQEISSKKNEIVSEKEIRKAIQGLKDSIPFYSVLTKYLWLLMAFISASFFLLIGNTVFRLLAIIYGLILGKVLGNLTL